MRRAFAYRFVRRTRDAGFSLISAIFLLVVLAGLGVAMVTLSSMQHQSTALDVQGVRAYQAAKAGIEWALFRRLRDSDNWCATDTAPATTHFALPAGTTLSGFTVVVVCTPGTSANSLGLDTLVVTSTACNLPTPAGICDAAQAASADYVERRLEVRLSDDGE